MNVLFFPSPTCLCPTFLDNTFKNKAWWCVPVVPNTWEAEAGGSPEPRSLRLWCPVVAPVNTWAT
uniref:Uncharacterized protein n=1 Tax=Mandrillus leucophaeus TaxID=9568 RepID=A0A2K5ZDR7_MANLE